MRGLESVCLRGKQNVRRFFIERMAGKDGLVPIRGTEARHMAKVLRMAPGDGLVVMDRDGKRFSARIKTIHPKEVWVALGSPLPSPPPSPVRIALCQALLKSKNMDYLIQKTSELGIHALFPCLTARTVVRPHPRGLENKMAHWRQIARSSAKQCNRDKPIRIGSLRSFEQNMDRWQADPVFKVILWEQESSRDLKSLLRESAPAHDLIAVVGPEGGFTRDEIASALEAGFSTASLGDRILRAETAAVAVSTIFQYEWGDLGK